MNRADIIALIRHAGVKRPKRRARRMLTPDTIRLRYFSAIRDGVLRDMRDLVRLRLVPKLRTLVAKASALHGDADDDGDVTDEIDKLARELAAKWTSQKFAQVVQPFAQDTARFSREQLGGVLRDQIGIDVVASEPNLAPLVAQWTQHNVALIKTVPGRFFPDIEKRLIEGLHSGERWEDLQRMLEERLGVSEANAVRIARDQVGKLFGQMNERRQKDLGLTGYIWRTVRDNRVRDLHEERDGQKFEWDDPPAETDDDGHPGEPIQCRCFAEPNLQGIFDEAWQPGELEQKPEPEERDEPTLDVPPVEVPESEEVASPPTTEPSTFEEAAKQAREVGAPVVPSTAAEAAAQLAALIDAQNTAKPNPRYPGRERVEANWRKKLGEHFSGVTDEDRRRLQHAINENYRNPLYREAAEQIGGEVLLPTSRAETVDRGHAAERDGMLTLVTTRALRSEYAAHETCTPSGGASTSNEWGFAASLRHELGHGVFTSLDAPTREALVETIPNAKDRADWKRLLTYYASKNNEEAFCEAFSAVTATDFDPELFPPEARAFLESVRQTIKDRR